MSGSGKTTLILEASSRRWRRPLRGASCRSTCAPWRRPAFRRSSLSTPTPIGINVRSTVATYANVHDELRKIFARTDDARRLGYKAGDFSYNTGQTALPHLRRHRHHQPGRAVFAGRGHPLPRPAAAHATAGTRRRVRCANSAGERFTLPELMAMDVHTALKACREMKLVSQRLQVPGRSGARLPDTRRGKRPAFPAAKRSG